MATIGVQVLGVGHTALGRLGRTSSSLASEAARAALADADLDATGLGMVFVATSLGFVHGQAMIPGQSWLRELELDSVPVVNVENACAGGLTALALGRHAVLADGGPVLVVGVEDMWTDRSAVADGLLQGVDERDRAQFVRAAGSTPPLLSLNARWALELIESGRVTEDELVAAAVQAYRHGAANPSAQHRVAYSAQAIRESSVVAAPLTRLMCASFTDGAAAVVLGHGSSRLPSLRSVASVSGDGSQDQEVRLNQSATKALEQAGVAAQDITLAEVHDATVAAELVALEAIGLFGVGEAGPAMLCGKTAIGGGDIVVNPSGGLIAHGHPMAATGLFQAIEVIDQLRGRAGQRQVEAARLGLVSNLGGYVGGDIAFVGTAIFEAGS